jgi:hypothetical protein
MYAKAADVVALTAKRVKVSAAQVYNVKAANGKPRRAKGDSTRSIEAKKLLAKFGGVERAQAAVNALVKLL